MNIKTKTFFKAIFVFLNTRICVLLLLFGFRCFNYVDRYLLLMNEFKYSIVIFGIKSMTWYSFHLLAISTYRYLSNRTVLRYIIFITVFTLKKYSSGLWAFPSKRVLKYTLSKKNILINLFSFQMTLAIQKISLDGQNWKMYENTSILLKHYSCSLTKSSTSVVIDID